MNPLEIQLPMDIFNQRKPSVWEKEVPILESKNSIDIYLLDEIKEPFTYNEMCHIIRKASEHDTVNLYINTPGGILDAAFMIIKAIEDSEATIIGHLSGTVASAGTMIALACDQLIVGQVGFMIHNYSGGVQGKGHEIKARQNFMERSLRETFEVFYAGFITEEEMNDIINHGNDLWLSKTEVEERWAKRQAYLLGFADDTGPEEEHN